MRSALLLFGVGIALGACKPGGVTKEQELCAKAAAMFDKCEELDLGSGSGAALSRELTLDRWRGLCRAVLTGETAQLMPNARELYQAMDDETKAGLKVQAECQAKAKDCADYKKCDE
ncbi:MAG TPA: hypothetical protein VMZ53_06650 [Kofleriaceae bacterium]|nr:hypothetical protein [Kofleriaceae bacterium]